MTVEIKLYQPEYHQEIVQMITNIQQKEFGLPITYQDQPDLANIEEFFDIFLVATYKNLPVGTIGTKIIKDFAILRKMFIKKEFRSNDSKIALQLLKALEKKIIENNITKIYLGTTEFFHAAHRFYEKNNYYEISKADLPKDFPVMKIDTKFYCKELA